MKITREQLIKMIKEELGDPAGEAEAERQRRARTAWKRRFTSVEEVNAIADLMENDPEFEMLSRFAEEFRRRSQRGTPPQDVLEVVLPESVPGGLIAKVILKARERLPADETPIKKPKSPALSGAEMDRIAPSLEETKTNKMKITKKQLKEIVEEEYSTVLVERELNEGFFDTLKKWFYGEIGDYAEHERYVRAAYERGVDYQTASAEWQKANGYPFGKKPSMDQDQVKQNVSGVAKIVKKAPKAAHKIDPYKAATGELFDADYQRDPNLVDAERFDMINYARAIVRAKCPGKFDWSKPGIPLKPGKSWGLDDECSD